MNLSSHFASRLSTRRSILRWSGAGVVAAAAASFGLRRARKLAETRTAKIAEPKALVKQGPHPPAAREKQPAAPVKPMSRESFAPHLGSEFRLQSDDHITTVCKLVEVSPAERLQGRSAAFTSFALLFEVPPAFPAESKVYVLTHDQLGEMKVFLSPVGKSERHVHLEAVFSQGV